MGLPVHVEITSIHQGYFSTWETYSGVGSPSYPSPVYAAYYALMSSVLHLNSVDVMKLLMFGSFFFAGVSMCLVVKRLTNHFFAGVIASMIMVLNQSFLSQIAEGHYQFVTSIAFLPVVFYLYYKALDHGLDRSLILAPIVFVIYGMITPPNIIIMTIVFLGFFTIILWLFKRFPLSRTLFATGALFLILIFVMLSVELANGIPAYQTIHTFDDTLLWSNHSILDALKLSATENSFMVGSSISGWVFSPELIGIAGALSLIVPILALSAPIFSHKRSLTITLVLCCILMAFMAEGPYGLFSDQFKWAFENIPMVDSIRVFSRFGLLIGFCYSILIGVLVSNLHSLPPLEHSSIRSWFRAHQKITGTVIACVIALSLLLPSSSILVGAIGGFNFPDQYQEPFEVVAQDGADFRVLTLPLDALYYDRGERLFNYTDLFTMDPGTFSPLYTGKDTAYGPQSNPFWYYIRNTVQGQHYGYRTMPMIIGSVASVKYLVGQVYASTEEKTLFEGLGGLSIVDSSPDGWVVLSNEYWQPRVSAYGSFYLAAGGRGVLSTGLGCEAIDIGSSSVIFLSDVTNKETMLELADRADRIVIQEGDLMELLVETGQWETSQRIFLSALSDVHTTNASLAWVQDDRPLNLWFDPLCRVGHPELSVPGTAVHPRSWCV